jgi:hypothetical protein
MQEIEETYAATFNTYSYKHSLFHVWLVGMAIKLIPAQTIPALTGKTRVDWVWVRVWVFPDFKRRGWGG